MCRLRILRNEEQLQYSSVGGGAWTERLCTERTLRSRTMTDRLCDVSCEYATLGAFERAIPQMIWFFEAVTQYARTEKWFSRAVNR
ncbi:MAG: hypothetical protein OJF47_004174 [Nitrospira sp.]|nr:MAG: hypothetical protein OJF47_004174 [Nitrospira sp.]